MNALKITLMSLMLMKAVCQPALGVAEYNLETGILTLPKVRLSSVNKQSGCVSAKLKADNLGTPRQFHITQLSQIPQGFSQSYNPYETQLLGDSLILIDSDRNYDFFNILKHTFITLKAPPVTLNNTRWGRIDDKLFLVGGFENQDYHNASKVVWVYDLVSSSWSHLRGELPIPVYEPKVLTVNGKLYIIGGVNNAAQRINKIQVYDPHTSSWSIADTQLPKDARETESFSLDDKIVIVVYKTVPSYDSTPQFNKLLIVYDPLTNTSTTLSELADSNSKIIVANNELYSFSAIDYTLTHFDSKTHAWSKIATLPKTLTSDFFTLADNNQLYFASIDSNKSPNQLVVERYDLTTAQWQQPTKLTQAPECPADAVYMPESATVKIPTVSLTDATQRFDVNLQLQNDAKLLLTTADQISSYQPSNLDPYEATQFVASGRHLYSLRKSTINRFNVDSKQWQNFAGVLGNIRDYEAAVATNDALYGFGRGESLHYPKPQYVRFSLSEANAAYIESPAYSSSGAAAALFQSKIYALGGGAYSRGGAAFSSGVNIYDPLTQQWSEGVNLPICSGFGAATTLDGVLYYSGGEGSDSQDCSTGFSGKTTTFNQLLRWNGESQQWETLAPMPESISGHQMLSWQGEIYVLKNALKYQTDESRLLVSKAWIYNPTKNQWRAANLPLISLGARVQFQVLDNTLYALQLKERVNVSFLAPIIWRYNLITKQWDNLTPNAETTPISAAINAQGHIQDVGWDRWQNNASIGQPGSGKRLEAVRLLVSDLPNCTIRYRAKVKDQGWTEWVQNGAVAGIAGQGIGLENFQIYLKPWECEGVRVNYRVALKSQGWQAWITGDYSTSATAVAAENSLPMEALEIAIELR